MSYTKELFDFIKSSPTAYHTVETVKDMLVNAGFTQVSETDTKQLSDGGKHFVIRGGSSIIAFKGSANRGGFMISASHSDSPAFKIKGEACLAGYTGLATEKYGGMIHYTWLDRPLSVAGRLCVKTEGGFKTVLVNAKNPVLTIPSVAIHLNRSVNDGYKFNPAVDLLPFAGGKEAKGRLMQMLAEQADASVDDIVSHDLFLYNADEGKVVGIDGEYILAPRIDDLGCVYASVRALLDSPESSDAVSVLAVFDNEEVGSETKQGAMSTFLDMTLRAIAGSDDKYRKMLANSFMISADNAHALHPNHPDLYDRTNNAMMGEGIVVKYNANQRYATDAVSEAVFAILADRASVKLQKFSNRADMVGGSTLGSISDTRVSIPTVDIGLPQLAMHSANETAAVSDLGDMISVMTSLYSSFVECNGNDVKIF